MAKNTDNADIQMRGPIDSADDRPDFHAPAREAWIQRGMPQVQAIDPRTRYCNAYSNYDVHFPPLPGAPVVP